MSTDIPQFQKAWKVVCKGEPSKALVLDESAPVPTDLGEGEVLVKVQAAALNPAGYKIMKVLPNFIAKRPHVPEVDLAGIVVDSNGTEFMNMQQVFGMVPTGFQMKMGQGALAQFTRLPAESLVVKPENIKPTEAAGVAVVGLTAYQALMRVAKLEPGQSLFVNGGSTSVGTFAIQLAKAIGCTVTATASGKNEGFVKSCGADTFIDYTKGPVHTQLENNPPSPKFHVMLEAVGNIDMALFTHSEAYLAPGGIFISVGPQPSGLRDVPTLMRYLWEALLRPAWLGGTKRTWRMITVSPSKEDLKLLAQYVAEGKVKPRVDSVFAFEDALKAYERIMTKRATGKVVVKVDPQAA